MTLLPRPGSWRDVTEISGMAAGGISEALTRIEGAFAKLRIPGPRVTILVNLAPADLLKEGTWLDLPLAVIMLQAAGMLPDLPESKEGEFLLMGELGIHGEVRRVPGALSLAFEAKPGQKLIVPAGNEKECLLILAKPGHSGCAVYPVSTLSEVIAFFSGKKTLENALQKGSITFEDAVEKAVDFGRVRGQVQAKRAAVISAAGGHNLLLIGPPGEGKSLLASAIPGILPRLSDEEKVVLTKIFSACGCLERDGMAVTRRPFRQINQGTTKTALIGGGTLPRPGEITLSHLGVLFLDEIAEFNRATIECLRQPMESGEINISRVKATMSYPCRFTLVAAMNPCPCGYYGTDECRCKPAQVKMYQQKLSGPIIDRIDLQVQLERLSLDDRFAETQEGVSAKLRQKVEAAREKQRQRYKGKEIACNAAMPGGYVREFCQFEPDGFEYYKTVIDESRLSTRSMDRLAKVARTIADLGQCNHVEPRHIEEAKSFVVGGMLREQLV